MEPNQMFRNKNGKIIKITRRYHSFGYDSQHPIIVAVPCDKFGQATGSEFEVYEGPEWRRINKRWRWPWTKV